MALSRNYPRFSAIMALFFLSLSSMPLEPGGIKVMVDGELRKMVLGSRPPACVNRCMSCRPCEATLVIPPHKIRANFVNSAYIPPNKIRASFVNSAHREDGSYYLLSWKCRCGNKIYQP